MNGFREAVREDRRMRWLASATAVLLAWPTAAVAWGRDGHGAVAAIAADLLRPGAAQEVARLLGGDDARTAMIAVASWADEVRPERRETARWHSVNIPLDAKGYDPARDCRKGDCAIGAIERFQGVLADRSLLPAVRTEALKFLVHFVGDIHQPLHASDNGDRGGSQTTVRAGRRSQTLHAYWDSGVVKRIAGGREALVGILLAGIDEGQAVLWSRGRAADWAEESREIVRTVVYAGISGRGGNDQPILLDGAYEKRAATVAAGRLRQAAIRLAAVLNAALVGTAP